MADDRPGETRRELDQLTRADDDQRVPREQLTRRFPAVAADAREHGLERLGNRAREAAVPGGGVQLTDRQQAVLTLLAEDATYQEIAAALGFSHGTIRKDAIATYRALGVSDRKAAVALARDLGLVGVAGEGGA